MKKLLLAVLTTAALSGCALVDAYLMTHYDPNEYQIITSVRLQAQQAKTQCDDAAVSKTNAVRLESDTQMFVLYSEHIPRNKDLIDAGQNLHSISKGLSDQYNKGDRVSPAFCKIKFQSIETSADKIQAVVAGRPR
jgi:hypothetical protein